MTVSPLTPRSSTAPARATGSIPLRGVRVHNLKGVDVDIPLDRLTVICGVSGSGKSSLAFDTVYAEGQRRYIETFAPSVRQHLETLEKPDADFIGQLPPAIALRQNSISRTRQATVSTVTEINDLLRICLARYGTIVCPDCRLEVRPYHPDSVVQLLQRLPEGTRFQIAFPWSPGVDTDADAAVDRAESRRHLIRAGYSRAVQPVSGGRIRGEPEWTCGTTVSLDNNPSVADGASGDDLLVLVDRLVAGRTAVDRLTESLEAGFQDGDGRCSVLVPHDVATCLPHPGRAVDVDGSAWNVLSFARHCECAACGREFPDPDAGCLSFRSARGACAGCHGRGVIDDQECPDCRGSRLSPEARAVRWCLDHGPPEESPAEWPGLAELERQSVDDLLLTLQAASVDRTTETRRDVTAVEQDIPLSGSGVEAPLRPDTAGDGLVPDLLARLGCLSAAGVGYLPLNRAMSDLSRGEAQRVGLTAILSSQLVSSLFILDEPSTGLHAADLSRLTVLLQQLRDAGNTVVVVEHDTELLRCADHILEIGPGSGASGGRIVFEGTFPELLDTPDSVTAQTLHPEAPADESAARRSGEAASRGSIVLTGCRHHVLQEIDVEFPLGCLCVVAGVSGSGKSCLVEQTLYPALHQMLHDSADGDVSATAGLFDELRINGTVSGVELVDDQPLKAGRRSSAVTWLKILAEIRHLFAATPDARHRNLTPAHFSFNTDAGGRCPRCSGTGFIEIDMQFMADVTMACPDCHGSRFLPHILEVAWRNRTIADVLAMTADEAFGFFRGERGIQKKLVALRDVGLGYLPLGQPLASLSGGEAQRLKLARHLAATRTAGSVLILNEPTAGLHAMDVRRLLECFRSLINAGHSLIVIEHQRDVILAADHVIELGPGAGPDGGRVVASGPPEVLQANPASPTGCWLRPKSG